MPKPVITRNVAPSEAPDNFDPQPFGTDDPEQIYLLTSLTAGSSMIVTNTQRLQHLLTSKKIPYKAVDTATDPKARRLFKFYGEGKKLPMLVRNGTILGDWTECEEWNEYGELKQNLGLKKKKKKKVSSSGLDLDGKPGAPRAVKTAKPNIVEKDNTKSTTPVGGIATPFKQASIAEAAAAIARKRGRGVKKAVDSVEGKSSKEGKKEKAEVSAVDGAKDEKKKEEEEKTEESKASTDVASPSKAETVPASDESANLVEPKPKPEPTQEPTNGTEPKTAAEPSNPEETPIKQDVTSEEKKTTDKEEPITREAENAPTEDAKESVAESTEPPSPDAQATFEVEVRDTKPEAPSDVTEDDMKLDTADASKKPDTGKENETETKTESEKKEEKEKEKKTETKTEAEPEKMEKET